MWHTWNPITNNGKNNSHGNKERHLYGITLLVRTVRCAVRCTVFSYQILNHGKLSRGEI